MSSELLHCPVRGSLLVSERSSDGLKYSEEKRRIDLIRFLLAKGYPASHMKIETTLLRFGNQGRNSFRTDLAVLDRPVSSLPSDFMALREHIRLIAEVKRDNADAVVAKQTQVLPALGFIDDFSALALYWDNVEQRLFYRSVKGNKALVRETAATLLPRWGDALEEASLTESDLRPTNLLELFTRIEDRLHSEITDKSRRFVVMLQFLLLKLYDEHVNRLPDAVMGLQDMGDAPLGERDVVAVCDRLLAKAVKYYGRYLPDKISDHFTLSGQMLRSVSSLLAPVSILTAKREVIQDFYMYFAKGVYKWDLGQYFTPTQVVDFIVALTNPGAGDQIVDPACGSGDFLISALHQARDIGADLGDAIWGSDSSDNAVQVCVLNMVLNGDGKSTITLEDSLQHVTDNESAYTIALCNPPFVVRILEKRFEVLKNFDLGHEWSNSGRGLGRTDAVLASQEKGLLFAELCVREVNPGGRVGIVLPNGYLGNTSSRYLAFREWLLRHTRLVSVVAFPRFTFKGSGADVSASVLLLEKREKPLESARKSENYPFHVGLVESVGWSPSKQATPIYRRRESDGALLLDEHNEPVIAADFDRVLTEFSSSRVHEAFPWVKSTRKHKGKAGWSMAIKEVLGRDDLSIDPKRWCERVSLTRRKIDTLDHFSLGDVLEVIPQVGRPSDKSAQFRYVEIQDTADGTSMPISMRGWELPDRAKHRAIPGDFFVGRIWSSINKWFVAGPDAKELVVTNGFHRLRMKAGKKGYFLDVIAGLNTEAYRIQARAYCTGSDGLADIPPASLAEIILPVVSDPIARKTLQPAIDALLAGRSAFSDAVRLLMVDGHIPSASETERLNRLVQV